MKKKLLRTIIYSVVIFFIIGIFLFVKVLFNDEIKGFGKNAELSQSITKIYNVDVTQEDLNNFNNTDDPFIKGNVNGYDYIYHIKNGDLEITSNTKKETYNIKIEEDGVLLIYKNSTLIAQSKEPVSTSDNEPFKRNGDTTKNATKYSQSSLRSYAIKNIIKFKNYKDSDFKSEDYKYISFVMNDVYKGIDIVKYDKNLYNKYESDFHNIVFNISMKTIFLLDYKVNSGSKTVTLYKDGKYLVNCDYGKYDSYSNHGASKGGSGIVVPSGVTLDLNGSTIKQIKDDRLNTSSSNYYNYYKLIKIVSGKSIKIKNGILVGDRSERPLSIHSETGTGIYIYSYEDLDGFTAEGLTIKYFSGDGIEVNKSKTTEKYVYSNNINILNNYIYACSRQGISVVMADSIKIDNNIIYNIFGTEPSAAIDIEPNGVIYAIKKYSKNGGGTNYLDQYVDNIVISNNILDNFKTIDMIHAVKDATIKGNTIYGRLALSLSDGVFELDSNYIADNKYNKNNDISLDYKIVNGLSLGTSSSGICKNGFYSYALNDPGVLKFAVLRNNTINMETSFNCSTLIQEASKSTYSKNVTIKDESLVKKYDSIKQKDYNYIKITKSANKEVYWLKNVEDIKEFGYLLSENELRTYARNNISKYKGLASSKFTDEIYEEVQKVATNEELKSYAKKYIDKYKNYKDSEFTADDYKTIKAEAVNEQIRQYARKNISKYKSYKDSEFTADDYKSIPKEIISKASSDVFDPTGMELDFYGYNVTESKSTKTKLSNIKFNSKKEIEVGGKKYNLNIESDKYVSDIFKIKDICYKVEVSNKIGFISATLPVFRTTTMIPVSLIKCDCTTGTNKATYKDWRRVKAHVAISDDNALNIAKELSYDDIKDNYGISLPLKKDESKTVIHVNEDLKFLGKSIGMSIERDISTTDRENSLKEQLKKNYIKINTLAFGQEASKSFEIYSNYYVYNEQYFHNSISKVPNEYIKYTIGNDSKLDIKDIDSKGNITVVANYLGITLKRTFNINGLIPSSDEIAKSSSFLGSTIIDKKLVREKINSIHILFSDEYINMSSTNKNNIFSTTKKWVVGSQIVGSSRIEIIAGFTINSYGVYDVYIAPNTTTKGVKIKANVDSSYLFSYLGYNTYCSDKKIIYGLDNLDKSNIKNNSNMYNHIEYNINYVLNGGIQATSDVPTVYTYGVGDTIKGKPTRSGYTFNGWQLGTTKAFSHTIKITDIGDKTLTALWCRNCATVSNGTCTLNASTAGTCTYTTKCDTGYTISNNGKYNPNCTANKYTIQFNANGGTGTMSNLSISYNTKAKLTGNKFTRKGYTFVGWNTKSDGEGTKYSNNQEVSNLTTTNNGKVVLYAMWQSNNELGDINSDGKINYLDYVAIYNHIEKQKNPKSSKKALTNDQIKAADMNSDGKISYLDYVGIYNKIKKTKS